MKNLKFLLFLTAASCLLMQSCKQKVDPSPELSDVIYQDLKSELEISTKQETDLKGQLAKDIQEYRNVPPQKGKSAIARNKTSMSENLLNVSQQQKKFFEIRIEQRKIFVQQRYKESLGTSGRPWPDEKELTDYKIRMKLQQDKFNWDTKNVPRGTDEKRDKEPVKKDSAPKKAEVPPASH
jgi:hypothetical protein